MRATASRIVAVPVAVLVFGTWVPPEGGRALAEQSRNRPAARDTPARPAPKGTARLSGRVVAADSGRPIKRARVVVNGREPGGARATTTDETGRYDVSELPAGRYTVTVSKTGFVSLAYGQRRPLQPGTPLDVGDGQTLRNVDFTLPRGSVITGRLADEDGEPLAGATVRVLRYVYRQGERRLVPADSDETDDRGQYRLYGLMPGDYYVSATFRTGGGFRRFLAGGTDDESETLGYAPTYYPGVTSLIEAVRVPVGVGQEAAGIDFGIQLVPTARVSGVVFAPDGRPPARAQVFLTPDDGQGPGLGTTLGSRVGADGSFAVANVPPGRYVARARTPGRAADQTLFANQVVTVAGQDVSGLALLLAPGATITGAVTFEPGTSPPPSDPSDIRVTAVSLEPALFGGSAGGRVDARGTFELTNVPEGRRLIRTGGAPRAWTLKAVYLEGRDVTDTPLDVAPGQRIDGLSVVFSDRVAELSGAVTDGQGRPLIDYTVVVYPTEAALWHPQSRHIQAARPDQNGRYQVRALPAGEYLVAAVDAVEQGEWYDPAFLEPLRARASRLLLGEGEIRTVDLKVEDR